jgi:hypothetical protein
MKIRHTLRRLGVALIIATTFLATPSPTSAAPQPSSATEFLKKSD